MAVPEIRGTDPAPYFTHTEGRAPMVGDLIVMLLPAPAPVPPGWTRRDHEFVWRWSDGTEGTTFPAPAKWFTGADPDDPWGTENSHP